MTGAWCVYSSKGKYRLESDLGGAELKSWDWVCKGSCGLFLSGSAVIKAVQQELLSPGGRVG